MPWKSSIGVKVVYYSCWYLWISAGAKDKHKFRLTDNSGVALADGLSERGESQPHQLKVLPAKRNANNGNAKQYAEEKMGEGHPYSPKDNPEDIHQCIEAPRTGRRIRYPGAEWHQ